MDSKCRLTRRHFGGMLAGAGASVAFAQGTRRKPNIVFILADDLGYGNLGSYGQSQIRTPNLDRMAAEGTRFTQAYAGSTVCAPSRCALMTGYHTGHVRIRGNKRVDLQPSDVTVAKALKDAGYRTAIYGKWGLGSACSTGVPNAQGFDDWFGYLDQKHAHFYYPDHLWENGQEHFLDGNFGGQPETYSHDLFTPRALKFMDQNRNNPFFLYLAFTLPHANNELGRRTGNGMEVPSDEPYSRKNWPQPDKNYAAMVTRLDRDCGVVLDHLKKLNIADNTLVIFSSDNGPHREGGHDPELFNDSGPLRGIKRDLYEGGIRVPTIAWWPGRVRPGATSDQVWAFWDFMPTAADLAGAGTPGDLDGVSIAPALVDGKTFRRGPLYWEFHESGFSQAVRMGDWKGVRPKSRRNPVEVFNLEADLGERNNVAAQNPKVQVELAKLMETSRTESEEFPVTGTA